MQCDDPKWWDMFRRSLSRVRAEMRTCRERIAFAHLPLAKRGRTGLRRLPSGEQLEPRMLLVSALFQVNAFETWNADPRVIPSSDPAGIAYHPPSGNLFIADSEIEENPEFGGHNVFEVNRTGSQVQSRAWPGENSEPTGITWNEADGYFYITNDDDRTITRFDEMLNTSLGTVKTRPFGVGDPEDIASDPEGNLYVVNGHPPLVGVFDSEFNFVRQFSTADQMADAEGIAYDRRNGHLFLVSAVDQKIFEYTNGGGFVTEYSLAYLTPQPQTPQGLAFAPCTDGPSLDCLFIADGGKDNNLDGQIYEVRVGETTPPVARHASISLPEDSSAEFTLDATDEDNDQLEFMIESGPSHGTISGSAPRLTYTPPENFHGTDQITFRALDGWVGSQSATVSFTVTSVNDPPVAENLAVTTEQGLGISISLSGIDADDDSLDFFVLSEPTDGQVFGTAPNLFYLPNPNFQGTDHILFQVADPRGSTSTASATIKVRGTNEPVTQLFQQGRSPTEEYVGTHDTKIRGDWPDRLYGSSSLLEVDGKPDVAVLLRWDLSAIPSGSLVQSAALTIHVENPSADRFGAYRLLRAWDEETATFFHADAGTQWQTAGVVGDEDRESTVLALLTAPATGRVTIPFNGDGLAAVQNWIENPAENFGFIIQDFDDVMSDALEFASSNHNDPSIRPELAVVFTPPTEFQPLTNPHNQYDVNNDGAVSPGDALVVINRINGIPASGEVAGEDHQPAPPLYPDVSGDGIVAPFDVLLIINYLNTNDGQNSEGEFDTVFVCEMTSSAALTAAEHYAVNGRGEDVAKESSEPAPELEMSGEDLECPSRRSERQLFSRRSAVFAEWPDRFDDESGDY